MSAKSITAPPPVFVEAPPFVRLLRTAAYRLVQRFTRTANAAERVLAIEDQVAIGPRKSLLVVRCHGRRFLVATAGDTIGPVIEVAATRPARRQSRERKA